MGNCDVKIEINRSNSGGTFTNYDVLHGTVKLTVTGAITLNYIQVKLEGIAKTQLNIPRPPNGKKDRKDKSLQDIHKVLYDTLIVFPPGNVRQVTQAKEFTLTPGTYSYPFEFKIPLNNSCVKVSGLTNKVMFNTKSFDLKINNGNFNAAMVKNMANQYLNGASNGGPNGPNGVNGSVHSHNYHVTTQLPPSLSGVGDFATIKYFVKVTCKRSSFLKVNLRAFDPFIFLPLDLDSHNVPLMESGDYEEYREVFIRKDLVFKNRIPQIVGMKVPPPEKTLPQPPQSSMMAQQKKGFFQKFFDPSTPYGGMYGSYSANGHNGHSYNGQNYNGSPPPLPRKSSQSSQSSQSFPQVNSTDVPFSFEAKFRHPAFLIPTKPPSFKLYLVSTVHPSVYSLAEFDKPEESNGLGVIYLQRLIIELTSTTIVSVLENDGSIHDIHKSKHEDVITICNNTYDNLRFDLKNCKKSKSSSATSTTNHTGKLYELEIPKKYFSNCVLPDYLSPSFKTCNIQRKYKLTVVGGFSSEKVADFNNSAEVNKKVRYVDLQMNEIKVLGGLTMTSSLQSNASGNPSLHSKTSSNSVRQERQERERQERERQERERQEMMEEPPRLPTRPSVVESYSGSDDSLLLPTYDDVMRESSYQNDSDHQRARRRYQQHEHYYNNLES